MVRTPRLALAILVGLVAASIIRDNVTMVNSRVVEAFKSPPSTPAPLPDLTPITVALALESATVGGPAPALAAAVTTATMTAALPKPARLVAGRPG